MQLSPVQKQKISAAIKHDKQFFPGSDAKHATSLGVNPTIYSRMMKGETEKVLREADWVRIGRQLEVELTNRPSWKIVKTPVYMFIVEDLRYCQDNSIARMFCDRADIGKTVAARDFARKNGNAVYLDCSQHKTKHDFIRALANAFGLDNDGKLKNVQNDLVYYLGSLDNPLVILDEAGDLAYEAWLELKALWNALEDVCAWYMIGADGLKAKIKRHLRGKKVGYSEMFRRYGNEYRSVTPMNPKTGEPDEAEYRLFFAAQAELIIKGNLPGVRPQEMIKGANLSLTRLQQNILKQKKAA